LDFDGDSCAIIPSDTQHGKIVVDGIRSFPYDIWEAGKSAVKKEFKMDTFITHLVDSAKVDRTGTITNYASRALDISNHLTSAVYFAKSLGCKNITLLSPKAFVGKETGIYGAKYVPITDRVDGVLSYTMKGFVQAKFNPLTEQVEFDEPGHVGTKSFKEILDLADEYLGLVEILRILQGREIDGAKTGVFAEGNNPAGNEFVDAVKVIITPRQMITRQRVLKRDVSVTTELNEFVSLSPLGRIHDYVCLKENTIMDFLANGSNKIFLLQSLMTEEEVAQFNQPLLVDGTQMSLVNYIATRKQSYNRKLYDTLTNGVGDDITTILASIKDVESNELVALAGQLNISISVVAIAAYIATYTKDSKQTEGLTYGWLLFGDLLAVFSRGNKKFELFRLPLSVETAYIINKVLYVNDNKHITVDAADCDNVAIWVINNRPYGLIHKSSDVVVTPRKSNAIYQTTPYTIGTNGFKYHIKDNNPKDAWKALVKENGYVFDITMNATGRAVISINGKSISALMTDTSFDLNNKKVKIINNSANPITETAGTINNLEVIIIGEVE